MELRHLRYFVAVAEELHFRRAAERLYIAQPAVSEQIRKLEAELGVRLLDRTNRSVELTEAGAAMLEEARRVLQQAEVACCAARTAAARPAMRLRIGYPPSTLPSTVSRALRRLAPMAPNVEVRFQTAPARRLIDDVSESRLDVAVVTMPAPVAGLRVTSLGREAAVAVLPAGSPGAVQPGLTLERLAPTRVLVPPRDADPALHDTVVALCRRAGLAATITEAPEPRLDMLLLAVASGAGAAIVPASMAEQWMLPGLRLVELGDTVEAFESAVVTRPDTASLATPAFLCAVGQALRRRDAQVAGLGLAVA